jgi:hypothetical protein
LSDKAPSNGADRLVTFARECLSPSPSGHTEIGAMFCAYRVWCRRRGHEGMEHGPWGDAFAELCKAVGIKILPIGGLVYVLHTRVAWEIVHPGDGPPEMEPKAPAELWASALSEPARFPWIARVRRWIGIERAP